jgi:hypothetical protein
VIACRCTDHGSDSAACAGWWNERSPGCTTSAGSASAGNATRGLHYALLSPGMLARSAGATSDSETAEVAALCMEFDSNGVAAVFPPTQERDASRSRGWRTSGSRPRAGVGRTSPETPESRRERARRMRALGARLRAGLDCPLIAFAPRHRRAWTASPVFGPSCRAGSRLRRGTRALPLDPWRQRKPDRPRQAAGLAPGPAAARAGDGRADAVAHDRLPVAPTSPTPTADSASKSSSVGTPRVVSDGVSRHA